MQAHNSKKTTNNSMKKFLLITCIFFCYASTALAQEQLTFQYDAAGNQVLRQWVCIGCTAATTSAVTDAQIEALNKSVIWKEAGSSSAKRSLKAYPNPVSETLQVEWQSTDGVSVKSLEVFSLNGIRVFQGSYPPKQNSTSISFLDMVPGGYILRASYSDGKKEAIKIIKQ